MPGSDFSHNSLTNAVGSTVQLTGNISAGYNGSPNASPTFTNSGAFNWTADTFISNSGSTGSTGSNGGAQVNEHRQITNVAAGTADTDVVNVGQMNSSVAQGVSQANSYTDQRFNAMSQSIDNVAKKSYSGSAAAIAMANLPQAPAPGKSVVSIGGGTYQGQAAMAVGLPLDGLKICEPLSAGNSSPAMKWPTCFIFSPPRLRCYAIARLAASACAL